MKLCGKEVGRLELLVLVSTILEFNPLFQAYLSVKAGSVEGVSLYTFLTIMTIGGLWLWYGISIRNWPLIAGNGIKLFTALCVVIIYFN